MKDWIGREYHGAYPDDYFIKVLSVLAIVFASYVISHHHHGDPVGGGSSGNERPNYADKDGWFCYDKDGKRWPSNGECD